MVRYALDIDGVVANYPKGIRELTARLGIPPLSQPVGLEPEALDALMEERQAAIQKTLKDWIKDHLEEFWGGLDSFVRPEDLRAVRTAVAQGHELFWVSSRPSRGRTADAVAAVTLSWLQHHDLPVDTNHLLLGEQKSSALKEHHIQYHLDDLVPHAAEISFNSQTRVYLLRQPWNRFMVFRHSDESEYTAEAGAFGIPEVDSIAEYVALATQGE